MDGSPVLADSSYYIRMMRLGRDPLQGLSALAQTQDLAVCGVIQCEVGRALRSPSIHRRFHTFWDSLIQIPTDKSLWREVEDLLCRLDKTGRIIPLPDAVIACCALRFRATVLTWDHHFWNIPNLRVILPPDPATGS
jgi:predicted nucleic acid-binding protein